MEKIRSGSRRWSPHISAWHTVWDAACVCALGAQVCWLVQRKNHYSPFSCNCKIIFSHSVFLLANFLLINFVSGVASFLFDYFFFLIIFSLWLEVEMEIHQEMIYMKRNFLPTPKYIHINKKNEN